jgi:group I intron endonuclease
MSKQYFVYTIHNIKNNKIYVGISGIPQTRWRSHLSTANDPKQKKYYIHNAIIKHGENNFVFTVFQTFNDIVNLKLAEKYWIKFFNTRDRSLGYNLTNGGDGIFGFKHSEATKEKLRILATGRRLSEEAKRKCRAVLIGRPVSQETRDKYSKSMMGHLVLEETRNKISISLTGHIMSEHTRQQISIANTGRHHTEESKRKISETTTGRKYSKERRLSMTGEGNGYAKLTLDNVKCIRNKYNEENYSLITLSKEFNVSERTIAHIIYNQTWIDETYVVPVPRKINHKGVPKLTLEKANEIRKMYNDGITTKELAKLFDVTKVNIRHVVNNKTWKNK